MRNKNEVVDEILSLETKIKKVSKKIKKSIMITNSFQLEIIKLRDDLRGLYLELKEISEKEKSLQHLKDK
jgi:regulator of replication initiation timing